MVLDGTKIKMYNSSGRFLYYLPRDCTFQFNTVDADTDRESNLYVLAWNISKGGGKNKENLFEVLVFDKDGEFKNRFSLRNKSKGRKLALKSNANHARVGEL